MYQKTNCKKYINIAYKTANSREYPMTKIGIPFLATAILLLAGCAVSDWQVAPYNVTHPSSAIAPDNLLTLYYFDPASKNAAPLIVELTIDAPESQ